MKNQMDLIISVVALLLAGIIAFVWMSTKRTVTHPAMPTAPNTAPVAYPDETVSMATALPGGSGGGGGGANGFGGGGGFGKGPGGGGGKGRLMPGATRF
ncbi:MAG TPA: hypothetical protein VGL56_11565 [Fimbriimonadaceae bacterium]|jgi:hypothetical protein